ncbi:MAG TPA: RNA 2',3'-cyclic phosphodiesterase [Telluria sp.]|jgi:2'-5' RNA ligase
MNAAADRARLFLALWPGAAVRGELAAWRDGWTWPKTASPVRTERLHVTLHFLGDVASERLPELVDGLRVPFTPFTLDFGRNALWPRGIAVLEPDPVPPALLALHASLARAMAPLALAPDERLYRPHVTLARRAGNARIINDGPPLAWHIDRYALVRSDQGYTVLQDYYP